MPFRTVVSRYDEGGAAAPADPGERALAHALGKAREVAARLGVPPGGAVLGADTAVVVGGRWLGKPADRHEAREMIQLLAGREHTVITAVALISQAAERVRCDRASVRFRTLSAAAVDWYLQMGEWADRAGAYAIQGAGAALAERVEGDVTTVIGLPLGATLDLLEEVGLAPWSASGRPVGDAGSSRAAR
ncbi:MAG: nucleoside triphosphate pyrophosphatase [Miltoncostaeaceae bacterium]|nr:nucleoside triphosphate pyrophosphatase [Miltoncostaeaceae bacterium]